MLVDDSKIKTVLAKVRSNEKIAENTYVLEFENCSLGEILPGQFVAIEPLHPESCMIRPFSVFDYSPEGLFNGWLKIGYKVVGKNTELLSQLKKGDQTKIRGPLGNGLIPKDFTGKRAFLVAGGIGVAPLHHFNSLAENFFCSSLLFWGVKTASQLFLENIFSEDFVEVICATEDGSYDYKGLVSDIFEKHIEAINLVPDFKDLVILTCGPKAMMKRVSEICQKNKRQCFVFLETIMACGIGACLGCSVKMKSGEMKRICHDGPVFNAKEVDWDALS